MGGGGRGGVQNNTTTFVFNAMQSETLGFFSLNKILIEMNILEYALEGSGNSQSLKRVYF